MVVSNNPFEISPEILREVTAEHCRRSFYEFLVYFWDTVVDEEFQDNWHIRFICEELQVAAERVFLNQPKEYDLIINVPPGSSKSTICTIMFPAWIWTRKAAARILSGSYSAELSIQHAVKSRDVLKSEKFKTLFPGLINFKRDMDGKTAYENEKKGSRHVTSPGGTATGKHAHFIIIDDPLNPEQAFSDVEKKKSVRFMDKTLSSRKVNKRVTLTILIMQRLAEDDPTGHLLAKVGKPIRNICFPSELSDLDNVKPKEAEKFYQKGLLDPIRLDRVVLDEAQADLGPIDYAGQHLQSPQAAAGNIFKREYWKYYEELPGHRPLRITQSWDTAFKAKTLNDFNVCTTWYQYPHGHYLVDFFMEKMEYPQLKSQAIIGHSQHKPHAVIIEDKASGTVLIQELKKDTTIPVHGIPVEADKIARAMAVTPTLAAGNVYLPSNKSWTAEIVNHAAAFPGVKHDDIEDSITQYLNWVREQGAGIPTIASSGRLRIKDETQGY